MRQIWAGFAAVVLASCGSGSKAGPCEVSPPDPVCSQACNPSGDLSCPDGFHCAQSGTCNAFCTVGGGECGSTEYCTSDGRCLPKGNNQDTPDASCPNILFDATRTVPTVQLLIDQSGSMDENFGGVTRWQAVRSALVGPNGVVTNLADEVVFGATLYSGVSQEQGGRQVGIAPCPRLISTPDRALNNLGPITTALNNDTIEDTPTGPSIDAVVASFAANPPAAGSPPIIVLATDGLPDTCEDADPPANRQAAANAVTVAAAQRAFAAGIRIFVLSVGNDVGNAHLQQMANAGVGQNPATGTAPFYLGNDPASLTAAFNAIIGGVLSCELDLSGSVDPAQAAAGVITLNGSTLTFGTDWELVDNNTIRLLGGACTTLQTAPNPRVNASFPCGAVVD